MPNRIVRDAILDSERYLSLTHHVERVLFFELILLADDYGLVPLGQAFLARRTTACSGMSGEQTLRVVSALADADLLRVYNSQSGSRFAFLPRFGNAPRSAKPKWPLPPDAIGGNEIKDLQQKRIANAKHMRSTRIANAPETETETETETEKNKRSNLKVARARALPEAPPDCPHLEILNLWAEVLPAMPQHLPDHWAGARADHLRARWRETAVLKKWPDQAAGIAYFRKLFGYVGQSQFLTGKTKTRDGGRPFVIELEWLVKPTSWAKVIEGKYHQEATA